MKIKEIIDFSRSANDIIKDLKDKSVPVPSWGAILTKYDVKQHDILQDPNFIDEIQHYKKRDSNGVERDATALKKKTRITLCFEKLLTRRFAEFTFSIPVKREYANPGNDETRAAIINAIEKIYSNAEIDDVNLSRARNYYAACEAFTLWYSVKKPNNLYGFPSNYKLKCKTYSPMNHDRLYPLIDELDDMIAMSFEYVKKVHDRTVTYFETYTADKHYIWRRGYDGNEEWEQVLFREAEDEGERVEGEDIAINKIPGAYIWRPEPVFADLEGIRNDLEYTLSNNGNTIKDNATPILKVVGELSGAERPNASQRIMRVESGGDVEYVTWQQATDSIKTQADWLRNLYFMQAQMPDIAFDKMSGLGNIGYDARQTLFNDAHLRVNDEAGAWRKFLNREFNVIKAFLALMNVDWASYMEDITCKHIITPFILDDKDKEIERRMKANGGQPVESQRESIEKIGESKDIDATLALIKEESDNAAQRNASQFSMSQSMF